MNAGRLLLWAGLALTPGLLGCRSDAEPAAHSDEHAHVQAHDEGTQAATSAARVHIDPSMLRDLRLTTQVAHRRPAGEAVSVLGEVGVNEDAYAELGSAIRARVFRVLVGPGDDVKADQPLVELESVEIGRARAEVGLSRARVQFVEKSAERRRTLASEQLVSERELQASEAELAEAKARDRAASESLSALGASSGRGSLFTLRAPIAGTVIERRALRGRWVDSAEALFVISDLTHPWLVVHAFERDALRMRQGTEVNVSFAALPGQLVAGIVKKLGTQVDPRSRTIDVRIDLENPNRVLRPGMSANALIPLGDPSEAVTVVPVGAVQRSADTWCVFLPTDDPAVFELRTVGRGRELGNEVEIISGLNLGERVIVDGAFLLKAEADKAKGTEADHHH